MNNREVMIALLNGYKICNPNWDCKYVYLNKDGIITDSGETFVLMFPKQISGKTKIYMELIEGSN